MTTILVVDDELSIVELLTAFLEDEGYQVVTARNGEEGLACLTRLRPALVLCDMMMPVVDGREMCQKMQANPHYRSIPIVLMSAVSKALKLANCNYAAHLAKPFELDDVLRTVARLTRTAAS